MATSDMWVSHLYMNQLLFRHLTATSLTNLDRNDHFEKTKMWEKRKFSNIKEPKWKQPQT